MNFLNKILRGNLLSNWLKGALERASFKLSTYALKFFTLFNVRYSSLDLTYESLYQSQAVYASIKNHLFSSVNSFNSNARLDQDLIYSETISRNNTSAIKPLRVMMLGLRGFPNVQGGVETHTENLAPILVSLGCDLEVIVRSPYQAINTDKVWSGVKFTRIWAPKSKGLEAIIHTFLGVLYAAIKRPDILHIHAIGPAVMTPLARLFGLRVVVTHHGPDYDRQKWGFFARKILLLGEWLGMRFSNGRIVISKVIRELVTRKHGVNSSLIFNGVTIPNIDIPEKHIEKFGIQKNKYVILVSRFVPEKRHIDLIKAFDLANLPDYKLVLVGSSDHPDDYVQSVINAASSNPNIVLTGFQHGETLSSLYGNAAMFVLPSSHEGLSISLLEALSYGLPAIASNIPANLEVGLKSDCYFELGNVYEMAKLIRTNINQVSAIETRESIISWVNEQYNWGKIAVKTCDVYRDVLLKV